MGKVEAYDREVWTRPVQSSVDTPLDLFRVTDGEGGFEVVIGLKKDGEIQVSIDRLVECIGYHETTKVSWDVFVDKLCLAFFSKHARPPVAAAPVSKEESRVLRASKIVRVGCFPHSALGATDIGVADLADGGRVYCSWGRCLGPEAQAQMLRDTSCKLVVCSSSGTCEVVIDHSDALLQIMLPSDSGLEYDAQRRKRR